MTGAMDSVIGVEKELAIHKFLTYLPVRFESAMLNPRLHGVILTLDTERNVAVNIQRIQWSIYEEQVKEVSD
jgi:calcineurin-like phosphoesterase